MSTLSTLSFLRILLSATLVTQLLQLLPVIRAQSDGTISLCGESSFYNSTTVPYSFNNNAWGNDSSGYQCLDVLNDGSAFTVTYQWTGHGDLVKGYPYMKAHPSRLPVQLWNVSRLDFAADWDIQVTGRPETEPAALAQAYDDIALRCNVAVDMFLSDDAANSTGLGAPIEIMIWPWYSPSVKPLGWAESRPDIDKVEIDGVAFSLYHGWNDRQQHVFSWLAERNLTSTNADYGPLLKYIWQEGLLSGALYVGQLEFGTEIMFAAEETRFSASNYNLQIIRQGDPDDNITTASSSAAASATATSSRSSTGVASVAASATAAASSTAGAVAAVGSAPHSALYGILVGVLSLLFRT